MVCESDCGHGDNDDDDDGVDDDDDGDDDDDHGDDHDRDHFNDQTDDDHHGDDDDDNNHGEGDDDRHGGDDDSEEDDSDGDDHADDDDYDSDDDDSGDDDDDSSFRLCGFARRCVVCLDKIGDMVLLPCAHGSVCEERLAPLRRRSRALVSKPSVEALWWPRRWGVGLVVACVQTAALLRRVWVSVELPRAHA